MQLTEHDAGIAIASVWLALYVAMLAIMPTDHYPGTVIDVATAATHNSTATAGRALKQKRPLFVD